MFGDPLRFLLFEDPSGFLLFGILKDFFYQEISWAFCGPEIL